MKLYLSTLIIGMLICGILVLFRHYKKPKQVFMHIQRELESISWLFLGYKERAEIASGAIENNETIPFVAELGLITIIFIILKVVTIG